MYTLIIYGVLLILGGLILRKLFVAGRKVYFTFLNWYQKPLEKKLIQSCNDAQARINGLQHQVRMAKEVEVDLKDELEALEVQALITMQQIEKLEGENTVIDRDFKDLLDEIDGLKMRNKILIGKKEQLINESKQLEVEILGIGGTVQPSENPVEQNVLTTPEEPVVKPTIIEPQAPPEGKEILIPVQHPQFEDLPARHDHDNRQMKKRRSQRSDKRGGGKQEQWSNLPD